MTDSTRRVLIDYLTSVKPQLDDVLLSEKNAEFFKELSTVGDVFVKLGARRWADAYLDLPETTTDSGLLTNALKKLGPWRKGPFHIGEVAIDAEWRGDLKWERFSEYLPNLVGKNIFDIGASNGYHMGRLAERGPRLVLGLDPAHRAFFQFLAVQKYDPQPACVLVPTVWQTLAMMKPVFDLVLCLGVIYHQPEPMALLKALRGRLREGVTASGARPVYSSLARRAVSACSSAVIGSWSGSHSLPHGSRL
jgi:tRNA (mo5U34)-methyltransferase